MAVTSLWRIKGPIGRVLDYAENPDKTECPDKRLPEESSEGSLDALLGYVERPSATINAETQKFIFGINCSPASAKEEMEAVKKAFGKTGGTIAYHGYQSFAEGEVTPELAHTIGIQLAQELWGDRYQVIVATHLDKESHLHNHFVINTVSFVDGIKYHRTKQDYLRMQQVSDRLCREHALSVVEEKNDTGRNYGEWLSDKESKPTIRGLIRRDIDNAISCSVSGSQFLKTMEELGYEFRFRTETGALLKHLGIKPPGGEHFFRLRSLGEEYTLDAISERIYSNNRPALPFEENPLQVKRIRTNRPKKKLHGLYALYIRYCYELHIIERHPLRRPVSLALKADLTKLDRLDAQVRFMAENKLKSIEDVRAHKAAADALLSSLTEERRLLRNGLKVVKRRKDVPQEEAMTESIASHSAQLKELRKQIRLCKEIEERAETLAASESSTRDYTFEKENKDEYISRCGRTGRQDEPGDR